MTKFRSIILTGTALAAMFGNAVSAQKSIGASVPSSISAKEKQEGAKAHPEILNEFGGVYQSPQTAYVVGVGKNIAVQSGLSNAEGDFTVSFLNSPVNNAFAIPGGYIYITRQLTALCNSEAEMAGVLGHEVGHVAARHSKKREKAAGRASILGVLGQVIGGAIGDNGGILGAIGGLAQKYSGTLAQVFTLKYSRAQEEEADDLGIQYLSKAGYDPLALSDMLNSLAMQTTLDARAAGQDARSVPEWASTHPDPAKRVVRAAAGAKQYPASNVRKQDKLFDVIDGMLYGDDPAQGVIEGQEFLHPDLRLKFAVPAGYGMQNSAQAVVVNGNGGKALFTTAAYSGNKQAYIDAAFKAVAGQQQVNYGEVRQSAVNGLPVFYATAAVAGQNGAQNMITIYAYEFSGTQAYHFAAITPANTDPFASMFQSVRKMSQSEAAAIKPRKLRIVKVGKSDTISSIASKMAYTNLQTERFLALNGLQSNAQLQPGRRVKVVTY